MWFWSYKMLCNDINLFKIVALELPHGRSIRGKSDIWLMANDFHFPYQAICEITGTCGGPVLHLCGCWSPLVVEHIPLLKQGDIISHARSASGERPRVLQRWTAEKRDLKEINFTHKLKKCTTPFFLSAKMIQCRYCHLVADEERVLGWKIVPDYLQLNLLFTLPSFTLYSSLPQSAFLTQHLFPPYSSLTPSFSTHHPF